MKSGPNSVSADEFLELPTHESLLLESSQLDLARKHKSWPSFKTSAAKPAEGFVNLHK